MLFWKYPYLKNANYNQVEAYYWREFHNFEISEAIIKILPAFNPIEISSNLTLTSFFIIKLMKPLKSGIIVNQYFTVYILFNLLVSLIIKLFF